MFLFCRNLSFGRNLAALLILIPALAFFASEANGHAKMLSSKPADGEVLREAPKSVELTFNETLQTGSVNSIFVTDAAGRRVDKTGVAVSEDGRKIQVELENLTSGEYKVEWKALSTDEHLIKGVFAFKLMLPVKEGMPVPTPSQDDFQSAGAEQLPKQESGMNWAQTIARWMTHLATTVLFGGFVFLLLVLKPALRLSPVLSDAEQAASFGRGRTLFIRLAWLALALLFVSSTIGLVLQTSVVFDHSFTSALAPQNLLRTLTETSYGASWLLQTSATVLLFVTIFFIARENRNDNSLDFSHKTSILWLGLGICVLLFLAPSLTGHARAAAREYSFAVWALWLHLIAVGVWVGGLFYLALIMPKIIEKFDGTKRLSVLAEAIPRFSRLAALFSMLLALTGIYSSWIHVQSFSSLWTTEYGMILTAKISLFLPMLALGGLNSFILRPRLARLTKEANSESEISRASQNFYRTVEIETMLGILVLLLGAALAFMPLGHQH